MAISVEDLFHALREQLEYRLIDRPELAAYFAFERSFGRSDASSLARLDSMRGVSAQRAAVGPGNLALALHAAGNSDLVTTLEGMRQSLEDRIRATSEFRALVAIEKAMAEFLEGEAAPAEAPSAEAPPADTPPAAQPAPDRHEPVQHPWAAFNPGHVDAPPPAAAPTIEEPAPANAWNSNPTF